MCARAEEKWPNKIAHPRMAKRPQEFFCVSTKDLGQLAMGAAWRAWPERGVLFPSVEWANCHLIIWRVQFLRAYEMACLRKAQTEI